MEGSNPAAAHFQRKRPGWFTRRVFNPLIGLLTRSGLTVAGSRVLEVRGRSSGQPRRTPVNLLELGGERYLVAPRGETQWARNLRASGEGRLAVCRWPGLWLRWSWTRWVPRLSKSRAARAPLLSGAPCSSLRCWGLRCWRPSMTGRETLPGPAALGATPRASGSQPTPARAA